MTQISIEAPPSKTNDLSPRIRSFSKGKYISKYFIIIRNKLVEGPNASPLSIRHTPTIGSPRSSSNRIPKGILSRPLPTPELNLDHNATFCLIIQNGLTKDLTEDFLKFRQFYYGIWGNIVKIFRLLEKLMYNYLVPIALINGER
jgi:hypothetical protein